MNGDLEKETATLIESMAVFARRFVVLTDAQRLAFALWVLHTHAFDAAEATPYMAVTSAEKQSGKSKLAIEVAGAVVKDPVPTANASTAAVFRSIGSGPTLLFDEMDALWSGRSETTEEIRGILNAGHKHGAVVLRCVGEGSKQAVQRFPVFCPKALAGIGAMPETIADRSIPIRLKRRAPDEFIERARLSKIEKEGEPLRTAAAAWAEGAVPVLTDMEPDLPDELSDRAQDGAEPLLAIADLAGPEMGERARAALIELHSEQPTDPRESTSVRLLADIRNVFDAHDGTRIFTVDLIAALCEDEAGPWAAYHGRDSISSRALSKLLSPHDIAPGTVRVGPVTRAGYKRESFEDAWTRFLPAPNSPTSDTSPTSGRFPPSMSLNVGDVGDVGLPGGGKRDSAEESWLF